MFPVGGFKGETVTAISRIDMTWASDSALKTLGAEGAQHLVDALALVAYADLKIGQAESSAYDEIITSLPIDSDLLPDLITYADAARERAGSLKDSDAVSARLVDVAAKVPEDVRSQVFGMAVAMVVIDKELAESEVSVLKAFGKALGLTDEATETVFDEIVAGLGLVES
jgi:uncharacterized tellurite resistance protein B-like protein